MQSKFWPILIVTATSLILVRLGFWQLDRAEQKQRALNEAGQQQVLNAATWYLHSDKSKVNNRRVELAGQIIGSEVWLLDNQVYQGQVGYSVITNFSLAGVGEQILVNWGWTKAPRLRENLPEITLTEQPLRLTGIVKTKGFGQIVLKQTEEAGWPRRIQSMQALDITSGVIYADTGIFADYVQTYQPVVMPPEKHHAYAMQWFLLALANICVFIVALKKRGKNNES